MADLSDLIESIPLGDIAGKLGISESDAASAVAQAIPSLLGGMNANVATGGAASLEAALQQHAGKTTKTTSVDEIDTADGEKIVKIIFGENTDQVARAVADANPAGTVTKDIIGKVLPILAPIVISWLAGKFLGGSSSTSSSSSSSGGIGDLLGGLLGGSSGSSSASSSSGGIGDLLGGVGGDLLGNVLGGLLGGGKK